MNTNNGKIEPNYQKALETIGKTYTDDCQQISDWEEYKLLQELIDKETPKKVIRNITKETKDTECVCPECKSLVLKVGICNYIDNYCSRCGQKLDWSDYD